MGGEKRECQKPRDVCEGVKKFQKPRPLKVGQNREFEQRYVGVANGE